MNLNEERKYAPLCFKFFVQFSNSYWAFTQCNFSSDAYGKTHFCFDFFFLFICLFYFSIFDSCLCLFRFSLFLQRLFDSHAQDKRKRFASMLLFGNGSNNMECFSICFLRVLRVLRVLSLCSFNSFFCLLFSLFLR